MVLYIVFPFPFLLAYIFDARGYYAHKIGYPGLADKWDQASPNVSVERAFKVVS